MQHKPSGNVLKLSTRIRQAAAACDFSATADPLDEHCALASFALLY